MKASVNLEFDTEELKTFLVDAGVGVLSKVVGAASPAAIQGFYQGLATVMQVVQVRPGAVRFAARGGQGPVPMPDLYGSPPGYGPGAPGYAQPGPVGPAADNVRPMQEPPVIARCFPIGPTRVNEASWACCGCATANNLDRIACRHCSHPRCDGARTNAAAPPPAQHGVSPQAEPSDPGT